MVMYETLTFLVPHGLTITFLLNFCHTNPLFVTFQNSTKTPHGFHGELELEDLHVCVGVMKDYILKLREVHTSYTLGPWGDWNT